MELGACVASTMPMFSLLPSVYPRVDGGNRSIGRSSSPSWGLSPRGRGKPRYVLDDKFAEGSIPAWTGETTMTAGVCCLWTVYPRVDGGNFASEGVIGNISGLSPRGRGKRHSACLGT